MKLQLHRPVFQLDLCQIIAVVEDRIQLIFRGENVHSAALDLRDIQNIVDDGKQQLAGALDIFCIIPDLFLAAFLQDHMVHTHDPVDGSADLVGHIGQKPAFGFVRFDEFCHHLLFSGQVIYEADKTVGISQKVFGDREVKGTVGCSHDGLKLSGTLIVL